MTSIRIFILCIFLYNNLHVLEGASLAELILDLEWEDFKVTYSKSYNDKFTEEYRKVIYLNNRYKIAAHNRNPEKSFRMGINPFCDKLPFELENSHLCLKLPTDFGDIGEDFNGTVIRRGRTLIPDSVDWRRTGAVGQIKNQGKCGSCYAFAAAGALEGQLFLKHNRRFSLSEQQIIDCSGGYGNGGCNGGWYDYAYWYIKDNKGINQDSLYPYEGKLGYCRYRSGDNGRGYCNGYFTLRSGDEENLKLAVAQVGPIAVGINAPDDLLFHKSGIYYNRNCKKTKNDLTHAVVVVGYGRQNGQDYWLLKNSWGKDWGEGGFFKLARNRNNMCGIATHAVYPTL